MRPTWFLGLSLGLAPVGGWLAVRGDLGLAVLVLAGAVLFWVAGFDVLYALQDEEFDRRVGLFSLPARIGPTWARRLAALCHLAAALGFAVTGRLAGLGPIYAGAVAVSSLILLVQHLLLSVREPQQPASRLLYPQRPGGHRPGTGHLDQPGGLKSRFF